MSAFTAIVFADGFENVSIRQVVSNAGLARSTFYEHFSSKEDVLRACMDKFFSVIADCVISQDQPSRLGLVLDHLWSNRRLTDAIFSGHARNVLVRNQIDLVEQRLRSASSSTIIPSRLSAILIAESQLALVESWMRGQAFCPAEQVANGLHLSSRAAALALIA